MSDEQWLCGRAECIDCFHEWVAVWPLGGKALECPECGSINTDRTQETNDGTEEQE